LICDSRSVSAVHHHNENLCKNLSSTLLDIHDLYLCAALLVGIMPDSTDWYGTCGMVSLKRQYSGIERELTRALTDACESAKFDIDGFEWLTHRVDYTHFPSSLVVTWVFDNDAHMKAAMGGQVKGRMLDLTLNAFEDIGIVVANAAAHVEFDSQERCDAAHGGDWAARFSSRQRSGGKRG
jgi:hypothetical protein